MKLKLNRLLLVTPLLFALAIAPAYAQDDDKNGNNSTPPAVENNGNPPRPTVSPDAHISASDLMAMNREYLDKMEELAQRSGGRPDNDFGFGRTVVALAAIIVPFFFIAVLATSYFYWRHRRNIILHETLRSMIDKGVPIPPELIVPPEPTVRRKFNYDLRAGLIMIGIGIAFIMMGRGFGAIGCIPLFIGIALLIVRRIEKKNQPELSHPPTLPYTPPTAQ